MSRVKRKKMKRIRELTLVEYYIILLSISVFFLIITLFMTHGELFSSVFFKDSLDTGMDFFHSIEYTKGRSPYMLFDTLYPPLANLFYYILFRFIPSWQYSSWAPDFEGGIAARGTFSDLRVWQPSLIIFLLYTIVCVILLLFLVQEMFKGCSWEKVFSLFCVVSYGVLYAIERGNIIFLCVILVLFFVNYRKHNSPIIRELSLLALALAAGLKLYPALFGILLLYDKEYKQAVRAIIYGILAFILPCFVFKEGLYSIKYFIEILLSWQNGGMIMQGLSFGKICTSFLWCITRVFPITIDLQSFSDFMEKFNILASASLLLLGFRAKKEWHRLLICSLAIVLFQKQALYILSFLLIPLIHLIKEEVKLSNYNFVPFLVLTSIQMFVPIFTYVELSIALTNVRIQGSLVILICYLLYVLLPPLQKLWSRFIGYVTKYKRS